VRALETLARIKQMIKPDTFNLNFFETNMAIFQPIIDNESKKELDKIIEVQGKLIE
jgi:hypothetical protein